MERIEEEFHIGDKVMLKDNVETYSGMKGKVVGEIVNGKGRQSGRYGVTSPVLKEETIADKQFIDPEDMERVVINKNEPIRKGDYVRVRYDLEVDKYYGNDTFADCMKEHRGKIREVESRHRRHGYILKEDHVGKNWTPEMLDKVYFLEQRNNNKKARTDLAKEFDEFINTTAENEREAIDKSIKKWELVKKMNEEEYIPAEAIESDVVGNQYKNDMEAKKCGYCDLHFDVIRHCPSCPVKAKCEEISEKNLSADEVLEFLHRKGIEYCMLEPSTHGMITDSFICQETSEDKKVFNVGDKIRSKETGNLYEVIDVTDDGRYYELEYYEDGEETITCQPRTIVKEYELIEEHTPELDFPLIRRHGVM
mgnify:CR=1 FL=1